MVLVLSGEGAGDNARRAWLAGYKVLGHSDNNHKDCAYSDGVWWIERNGNQGFVTLTCRVARSVLDKIVGPTWSPVGDFCSMGGEYGRVIKAPAPGLLLMRNLLGTVEVSTAQAAWLEDFGYWTGFSVRKEWL